MTSGNQASGSFFQAIIASLTDAVIITDTEGAILMVNAAGCRLTGLTENESGRQNIRALDWLPDNHWEQAVKTCRDQKGVSQLPPIDTILTRVPNAPVDIKLLTFLQNEPEGVCLAFVLEPRRKKNTTDYYLQMVNASRDYITLLDKNYTYHAVNDAYLKARSKKRSDIVGHSVSEVWGEKVFTDFIKQRLDACFTGEMIQFQSMFEFADNEINYIDTTFQPCYDENGNVVYAVITNHNITEIKRSEEKIRHLAHYDTLTHLPNRLLFTERMTHEVETAQRSGQKLAMLFMDLDNFKKINDTLGHAAGDAVLLEAADRLRRILRRCDTVSRPGARFQQTEENMARLGGDEFTLLLSNLTRTQFAGVVAQKIIDAFEAPFIFGGRELFLSISIGISVFPDDGENVETLMKNAETAMYGAKKSGRKTFHFYAADMNVRAMEQIDMEHRLHRALQEDSFVLYYQPQYRLTDRCMVGTEALIRLRDGKSDLIAPARFIPLAEETGLIRPIGEWVLKTAAQELRKLSLSSKMKLTMGVNLSARQFEDRELIPKMEKLIKENSVDPRQIDLEITESMMMRDVNESLTLLKTLKKIGFSISLDDFGTGYSSLTYLKRFPIDTLKIDQSFIRTTNLRSEEGAIVAVIIAMAHQLGITVVAEGVETEDAANYLRQMGCDIAQGYYFSKPVPALKIEKMISNS